MKVSHNIDLWLGFCPHSFIYKDVSSFCMFLPSFLESKLNDEGRRKNRDNMREMKLKIDTEVGETD